MYKKLLYLQKLIHNKGIIILTFVPKSTALKYVKEYVQRTKRRQTWPSSAQIFGPAPTGTKRAESEPAMNGWSEIPTELADTDHCIPRFALKSTLHMYPIWPFWTIKQILAIFWKVEIKKMHLLFILKYSESVTHLKTKQYTSNYS